MALIALGAVVCTLGGGIISYFSFGGSKKVNDSETNISAEGVINNVIVKDIQDKIELENPVAIILYILCAIKIIAVIYFVYRRITKHMKKKYGRNNQDQAMNGV